MFQKNTGATPKMKGVKPLSVEEVLRSQSEDLFCQKMRAESLGNQSSLFSKDERGLLVGAANNYKIVRIILSRELWTGVLLLAHYSPNSGHPGGNRMYQALPRTFHWPSTGLDVYNTGRQCTPCAKERISFRKHGSLPKIFTRLETTRVRVYLHSCSITSELPRV